MKEENRKKLISRAMTELAKLSHKKKPRGKKFYQDMVANRKDRQKLSTEKK